MINKCLTDPVPGRCGLRVDVICYPDSCDGREAGSSNAAGWGRQRNAAAISPWVSLGDNGPRPCQLECSLPERRARKTPGAVQWLRGYFKSEGLVAMLLQVVVLVAVMILQTLSPGVGGLGDVVLTAAHAVAGRVKLGSSASLLSISLLVSASPLAMSLVD